MRGTEGVAKKRGAPEKNSCKGLYLLKGAGCKGFPPARRKGLFLLSWEGVEKGAHVYDQDCGRLRVLLRFGFLELMGDKKKLRGV